METAIASPMTFAEPITDKWSRPSSIAWAAGAKLAFLENDLLVLRGIRLAIPVIVVANLVLDLRASFLNVVSDVTGNILRSVTDVRGGIFGDIAIVGDAD
jgi:hypothetical protein